jgi:hypothetical protein
VDPGVEYYGYGAWPDEETLGNAVFSCMAAAKLAQRLFNECDTSVVSKLADQVQGCDITIPVSTRGSCGGSSVYLNSAFDRIETVDTMIQAGGTIPGAYCAVVGPVDLLASAGLSVLTETVGIPMVTFAAIDCRLSWTHDFKYIAMMNSVATDSGAIVSEYFERDIWPTAPTSKMKCQVNMHLLAMMPPCL